MGNLWPSIPAPALFNACGAGDAAAVSRLLPPLNLSGPRFQAPDTMTTPLIVAAWCGYTEIVRLLLERAPNTTVDSVDASRLHGATSVGFTALAVAAQFHHADVIRLLADRGASVGVSDQRQSSPLCLAVEALPPTAPPRDPDPDGARQLSTVKALLQLGAGTLRNSF